MNRRDVALLFIILLLVLIGYIYPVIYDFQEHDSVTIFVIDTFDDSMLSHGEIVSSIIEQEVPQFEIKKLNVKQEDHYGISKYYEALDQIYNYRLQNSDEKILVNISLGFYESENYHQLLIKNISDLDVGIIAAAGNDDSPIAFYPAAYEKEVIAVASIQGNKKTDYSNYGEYIDICAEGSFFTTISLPQFFSYRATGTSFAAPRVTAFLAKILSSEKDMSIQTAVENLNKLSVPLDDQLYEQGLLGQGRISNLKYLLNYNQTKALYFYLLPAVVFLLIFYLLIKKMGLIAVPYLLLLLIVLGPFFIFIRDYFLRSITDQVITMDNIKLTIIFIFSYLLAKTITSFEKYYLFISYLIVNSAAAAVMYFLDLLNLNNYIIFSIALILFYLAFEYYHYFKKKHSNKIIDLNSNSFKVLNTVKRNLIKNLNVNKDSLTKLFELYRKTKKKQVKKAIIDILLKRLYYIPLGFLYRQSGSFIVKNYLFKMIKEHKDKIEIADLFDVLKEEDRYINKFFEPFTFQEIGDQLMKEFSKKDIDIKKLIKVINYYNDSSIVDYLLSIYGNYEKCWHRYLLASTILKIADQKTKAELVQKFLNDKCGLVQEEAEYYRKKEGYSLG